MKKRDIDVFGVLIGIVIGCLFGYFIGVRVNGEKTKEVITDTPTFGNVYLLQILKSNDLSAINNTLKDADVIYEIVEDNGMYYVYGAVADDDSKLDEKKAEFITKGFNPVIKSDYILDWSNKYDTKSVEYVFYNDAITILLNSIKGSEILIPDKYFITPVDLKVFSNLTLLKTIKNNEVELQLQLETYRLLFEKLN
jgi:hypothetical protein